MFLRFFSVWRRYKLKLLNKIKLLQLIVLSILSTGCCWFGTESPLVVPTQQPVAPVTLENLPAYVNANFDLTGMVSKKNGYWYLQVEDRYIEALYPKIQSFLPPEFLKAPYLERPSGIGAHISLIYENEVTPPQLKNELGKKLHFVATGFQVVGENKKGSRKFATLTLEAKNLEAFRMKAGLSPLLNGHAFHITIAATK